MRIGKMRQRITITQRATGRDSAGEQLHTWSTFWPCWAHIAAIARMAIEQPQGGALQNPTKFQITIRFHAGVVPAMRVEYQGRIFNIMNVDDVDGAGEEMILFCEENMSKEG
jgi:SPP1 family predicted phage head-tail adaptor